MVPQPRPAASTPPSGENASADTRVVSNSVCAGPAISWGALSSSLSPDLSCQAQLIFSYHIIILTDDFTFFCVLLKFSHYHPLTMIPNE